MRVSAGLLCSLSLWRTEKIMAITDMIEQFWWQRVGLDGGNWIFNGEIVTCDRHCVVPSAFLFCLRSFCSADTLLQLTHPSVCFPFSYHPFIFFTRRAARPVLFFCRFSKSSLSSHKCSLIASNGDELILERKRSIGECFLPYTVE